MPFFIALCTWLKVCSKEKSKQSRFLDKIRNSHEQKLDIISFIRVKTDLHVLVRLLLNRSQLALFKNQNRRKIDLSDDNSSQDDRKDEILHLRGFKAQSQLDQKLLKGLFPAEKSI